MHPEGPESLGHNHKDYIDVELKVAAKLCSRRGVRLTLIWRRVRRPRTCAEFNEG